MGLSRLRAIVNRLVSGECSGTTPIAVISKGTYLVQDCRVGTLADIMQNVASMKAPAIIVIGDVVSLRNDMQWMELAGKSDFA
jgi:siroheme synthase